MVSDGPSSDPRSRQAAAISTAITVAAAADASETALQAILDAGVAALGATMGAIFLADPDRPGLTLAASSGVADPSSVAADVADPAHPFAQAVTSRAASFDRAATQPDGRAFVGSYLPLIVRSGGVEVALGSMGMGWDAPRDLDPSERGFLADLAGVAGLAIDRVRLASTAAERSEWFERMAHTDPLTGLANERTVARILGLELTRAGRQGSEVSLAIFDVDDFRAVNASDGHQVGDDILRRVAAVLAETVRLVDTVGRIGGDEFVLVAPGSAGALVARRVLDGIVALPVVAGRTVSVSAGVARFPVDGTDPETLIAAATAALAQAKDGGAGTVAETGTVPEA